MLAAAYAVHPERFVHRPPAPKPLPTAVWINRRVDPAGDSVNNSAWRLRIVDRLRWPASGVQCLGGCLSVQMSGVRCPAWVSGVRGFPRPLCPAGRWWRVAVGRQPHGWDGRRQRGRLPCPRPVRRLPGSEPGGRGWRRSAGQRRDRLGLGRRRRRWLGSGWVDRVGDQDWLGGRGGIARWWRAGVRSEAATTLCGHRVRPRSSRLIAASLLGWTATCACGRGAAAACGERRLLDAGDALICEGVRVRPVRDIGDGSLSRHRQQVRQTRATAHRC